MHAQTAGSSVSPPRIGPPHMSPGETKLLQDLMLSGLSRYLEFGTGGSTLMAVRSGLKTIVAVESDPAWAAAVRADPEIAPRVRDGSVSIKHADIGPIGAFGAPASAASWAQWHNYLREPWLEWERRGQMPELVLVDGRFRVASCLSVIVAVALTASEHQFPVVALHDVVSERPSYQKVFDYFDVIDAAGTLHVMRPKASLSPLKVFTALLREQVDGY